MKKIIKGFTLIEVLIALIISTLSGIIFYKYKLDQNYNEDIKQMNTKIDSILNSAVMDTTKGYINGEGGDCSNDNTYKDLTAGRAIKCIGWEDKPYKLDGDEDDASDSNIYALLPTHTKNGEGCRLYMKDKSDDEYYFFVDCSSMNKDRKKQLFESMIQYNIKSNFSTILEETYPNAISINNTTGGDETDGKIMFLMKK